MKIKKIICLLVLLISLSSCKEEKENYQSKNVDVDTIFDSDFSYDYSDDEDEELEKLTKLIKKSANELSSTEDIKEKEDSNLGIGKEFVISSKTDFRKEPFEDEDNIIEKIPKNSKVNLIKNIKVDGQKWSKISFNGNIGYVRRNALKNEK